MINPVNPVPQVIVTILTTPVNNVLVAMAIAEVLREKIDAIKVGLLTETTYTDQYTGERITDPKNDWCMGDAESASYLALLEAATRAAGYDTELGSFPAPAPATAFKCPALVAESEQVDAENMLIEDAEEFFPGVTNNALLGCFKDGRTGLETRREYIDTLIGLVVNHPAKA